MREKSALVRYFDRINDDYHNRRENTECHNGEVVYGYLGLNCAKTIGMAFKHGAGYETLELKSASGCPDASSRKR